MGPTLAIFYESGALATSLHDGRPTMGPARISGIVGFQQTLREILKLDLISALREDFGRSASPRHVKLSSDYMPD
jgi:hypothetical protein